MNWRAEAIDLLIIIALYVLVEFAATEGEPPTDWGIWLRAIAVSALYKAVPPIVQVLGTTRAKYGKGSDA